jgi:glutamate-1-semialdehyde aminotransferase
VILEPMNAEYPRDGFLEKVQAIAREAGAQQLFGVTPDLATFGKGIANGFPLSALVGRAKYMKVVEDVFLSGTFGGETLSLAAARAVLTKLRAEPVLETLAVRGQKLLDGVRRLIAHHTLEGVLDISGHPAWTFLQFRDTAAGSKWHLKTLFVQEVFRRGIYTLGTHNLSYAHTEADIDALLECYNEVFALIRVAVTGGRLDAQLECAPLVPLFAPRP